MLKQIVTASLLVIASSAYAQHDNEEEGHGGDIEGGIVGSQIIIAGGEALTERRVRNTGTRPARRW